MKKYIKSSSDRQFSYLEVRSYVDAIQNDVDELESYLIEDGQLSNRSQNQLDILKSEVKILSKEVDLFLNRNKR